MIFHSELIDPDARQWDEVLSSADHDFYHLPCYQKLAAQPDETPRAVLVSSGEHRLLMPYLERPIPFSLAGKEGLFDAYSAYGYPGPLVTRGAPDSFVAEAIRSVEAQLTDAQLITSFFRLHPLLNNPAQFGGVGEIVNHGPSVYIDLRHSEEELWQQTRRGHRREIVVLEKQGYSVVMNDWGRLDDFLKCYYESMKRVQANKFYFFPKDYFEGLRDCLGSDRIHLCALYLGSEVACAGIVTEMNGLCQYHLSATSDAHLADHPSKLMLHHLRKWLKSRGNRIYHVGGGVGALRDPLYLFKAGFSPHSADFCTWRITHDSDQYEDLQDRWSKARGTGSMNPELFFPPYRAS